MKNNQPVTQVERVLNESDSIVSKTDLKGRITYINQAFLNISGFDEQELIGSSHNIVRHPDMPVEAFSDLWAAMKANRPWTGLVKNRCKNGDYYWVLANVTPIFDEGLCTGYMSVRSKPTREQVGAAAAAYELFRNGRAGGLQIKDGRVVKPRLLDRLNLLQDTSINALMMWVLTAMSLLSLAVGVAGLYGMSRINESLRTVYEDRVIGMEQIAKIQKLLLTNRLRIAASVAEPELIRGYTAEVEQNIVQIDRAWDAYMKTSNTPEESRLAEKFVADRHVFLVEGVRPAIDALRVGDLKLAEKIMVGKVRPLYEPVGEGIASMMQLQLDESAKEHSGAMAQYQQMRNRTIVFIAVGLLLAIWAMLIVWERVLRPMKRVVALLQQVAQGHYDNEINVSHHDEMGTLLDNIKAMQIRMGFDAADTHRIANENLRIRIGLDNVSTSVVISDTEYNIIYMNNAATRLMKDAQADIRRELPEFDADRLMGSSIDAFHKNPVQQRAMLERLEAPHRAQIEIGGRTFAVVASPVIDRNNQRLGAALEWNDRTLEVSVEKEVAGIVDAAVQGDFSRRIDMQGKEGYFKQLAFGINRLLETADQGLQEVVRMLASLARGDLSDRIDNDYSGTFGRLKDDANATSDQLKQIIGQIRTATDTINTASHEIAAGNQNLSQRTEEQASSLEVTASSMEQLTSTVRQNAENAKQANQLAIGASDVAGRGGAVVGEVVVTMNSITESSKKIVDIISVIDGIAFQTNILALNAAVEAARAGEQGRGFAVVATEVRNLAQRSAAAAREIKALITDSVDKVEGGSRLVAEAGRTMEEIVTSIRRVTDIMSEISAASNEQSAGIEQVNLAITKMDEATQQNAALVEQAAAAACSLEEQAHNLSVSVSTFRM